jgi:hypothetical protein
VKVADAISDAVDRVTVAVTHLGVHRDTLLVTLDTIRPRVVTIVAIVVPIIRETTPLKVVLRVDLKVALPLVLLQTVHRLLGINYLIRTIK